jgi:hypothetical protein
MHRAGTKMTVMAARCVRAWGFLFCENNTTVHTHTYAHTHLHTYTHTLLCIFLSFFHMHKGGHKRDCEGGKERTCFFILPHDTCRSECT